MKVLLINGSPKAKGCTYTTLCQIADEFASAGIETEIFHIGAAPVGGCRGCGGCNKKDRCVFDDVVNTGIAKIQEADAVVFGSPVHFASISGNMTSFLDRVFCAASQTFSHKPAAICCTARRAGTSASLEQLTKYPTYCNMPLISAPYWPMVFGSNPDEIMQDVEGIAVVRQMARNMTWILNCMQAGKAAGFAAPEVVARPAFNFIR